MDADTWSILDAVLQVTLAFGRHGLRGTYKNHIFETKEEAKIFVCKTLKKRLTAPKRIGCPYVLVEAKVSDAEVLDAWVTPEQVENLTTSIHLMNRNCG